MFVIDLNEKIITQEFTLYSKLPEKYKNVSRYVISDVTNPYNENGAFRELTDADLKPFLVELANKEFESKVTALVADVPAYERNTWTEQKSEALAWLKDNSVSTPILDAILEARTKFSNKQELVDKVLAKAEAYAEAIGRLVAERQAKEDEL